MQIIEGRISLHIRPEDLQKLFPMDAVTRGQSEHLQQDPGLLSDPARLLDGHIIDNDLKPA